MKNACTGFRPIKRWWVTIQNYEFCRNAETTNETLIWYLNMLLSLSPSHKIRKNNLQKKKPLCFCCSIRTHQIRGLISDKSQSILSKCLLIYGFLIHSHLQVVRSSSAGSIKKTLGFEDLLVEVHFRTRTWTRRRSATFSDPFSLLYVPVQVSIKYNFVRNIRQGLGTCSVNTEA